MNAKFLVIPFLAFGLISCEPKNAGGSGAGASAEGEHDHSHENGDHDHEHAEEGGTGTESGDKKTGMMLDGAKFEDERYDMLGEGVHAVEAVAAADVLADPKKFAGKPIVVSGEIVEVCQMSGCWMKVGSEDSNMRVSFEPYEAVKMPMDSAGQQVLFEGVVEVSETSVEDQQHYLKDAGKDEEAAAITEPKVEAKFKAVGVALMKKDG